MPEDYFGERVAERFDERYAYLAEAAVVDPVPREQQRDPACADAELERGTAAGQIRNESDDLVNGSRFQLAKSPIVTATCSWSPLPTDRILVTVAERWPSSALCSRSGAGRALRIRSSRGVGSR